MISNCDCWGLCTKVRRQLDPPLNFASASKQVFALNHSYENVYRLRVHFHVNQAFISTFSREDSFWTEAQANVQFFFYTSYMYGLMTKCEVKMAGYWPNSYFACLRTETKRARPKSSHFERTNLVNKGFIIWLLGKFFLRDTTGSPERAR